MNKYLCKFPNISVQHTLKFSTKLILSIMNYCSEVWGFHASNAIERVLLHFCKNILGVKKTTQTDGVYGELDRMPLQNMRLYCIIKFWIKILHTNENK